MTSPSPSPPEPAENANSRFRDAAPWWIYPTTLLAAIVITALGARRTEEAVPVDGARRTFEALPWEEGMTVADLMVVARGFRPPIDYEQRGDGEAAFLASLEGVRGGGPEGRNWLYRVNGEHAQVSFGVHPLEPGDAVLWIYDVGE